jgi:hypothetical protein
MPSWDGSRYAEAGNPHMEVFVSVLNIVPFDARYQGD